MRFTTAISLLLGLGARIAFNKFVTVRDQPSIEDHVLSGLWQGVALYYFIMEFQYLAFGLTFGIAARLVMNFMFTHNTTECACTILGVALGVLFTDVLSQVLEDTDTQERHAKARYEGSVVEHDPPRRRLVQFRRSSSEERERQHVRRRREFIESTPSITTATTQSWDSLSDWVDPNHTMDPLEREVAALRKKASLADSERRRFKEEKKWALSQGNKARASQMGWQVKRYSALMQSFHREADMRLLEASNQRHRKEIASVQSAYSQVQTPAPAVGQHLPPFQPAAAPFMQPLPIPPRHVSPPAMPPKPVRHRRTTPTAEERPLPAGSSHTQHKKTKSILSKPSVRIEVHEYVLASLLDLDRTDHNDASRLATISMPLFTICAKALAFGSDTASFAVVSLILDSRALGLGSSAWRCSRLRGSNPARQRPLASGPLYLLAGRYSMRDDVSALRC
ncbi:hypothetical protein EW146_g9046 [Bondarzewia mesenterica]|uniref:Uncharacterized protein n=1 Tax=Bondarzewia mesenterica TaxID=1095465 RepID=A0A4S4LAZ5_9AGAM|nr:hypothetical protein EW146_g9046 [Bondarzewia mesenterica]